MNKFFCFTRDYSIQLLKHLKQHLDIWTTFEGMVNRISPHELQLNKLITLIPKPIFDLHLSISNGFVSFKIYDERGDFDFDIIVNFPFLDGDVPRSTSYGVYISQLIRFARVSSDVADFNSCHKGLLPNFSNRAIGITNFERLSPNFIADTMHWFLNSMLD